MLTGNMLVQFYEEILMDYPEYVASKQLLLYVPPVLLILGTFGNVFSIIILAKNMRRVSTYNYLVFLGVADSLVLYVGLLRLWIGQFTDDIRNQADWLCKVVVFLGYVTSDSSVWLIIAVTIERFIVVCFPLKVPIMCNVRRARILILLTIWCMVAINMHFLWTVELRTLPISNTTSVTQCMASADHEELVQEIWPWVDAVIYSFLPFLVITLLNILIINQVLSARKNRSQLQGKVFVRRSNSPRPQDSGSVKLTWMLLAVSFTFLVTTLPMNLMLIVQVFWSTDNNLGSYARLVLANTIAELLMYTNHSVNFFLYCATGKKFRRQFCQIFRICTKRERTRNSKKTTYSFRCSHFNSTSSPKTVIIDGYRTAVTFHGTLL